MARIGRKQNPKNEKVPQKLLHSLTEKVVNLSKAASLWKDDQVDLQGICMERKISNEPVLANNYWETTIQNICHKRLCAQIVCRDAYRQLSAQLIQPTYALRCSNED